MMPLKKRDVESALNQKGFRKEDGDHHYFVYYTIEGKKTRSRTKTSHAAHRDIAENLMTQMSKQIFLTKSDFVNLVKCPLSRTAYEEKLAKQGIVPRPSTTAVAQSAPAPRGADGSTARESEAQLPDPRNEARPVPNARTSNQELP